MLGCVDLLRHATGLPLRDAFAPQLLTFLFTQPAPEIDEVEFGTVSKQIIGGCAC